MIRGYSQVYRMPSFPHGEESRFFAIVLDTSSGTCHEAKPERERAGYIHLKVAESTVAI